MTLSIHSHTLSKTVDIQGCQDLDLYRAWNRCTGLRAASCSCYSSPIMLSVSLFIIGRAVKDRRSSAWWYVLRPCEMLLIKAMERLTLYFRHQHRRHRLCEGEAKSAPFWGAEVGAVHRSHICTRSGTELRRAAWNDHWVSVLLWSIGCIQGFQVEASVRCKETGV
jgi:hypothetical protein